MGGEGGRGKSKAADGLKDRGFSRRGEAIGGCLENRRLSLSLSLSLCRGGRGGGSIIARVRLRAAESIQILLRSRNTWL